MVSETTSQMGYSSFAGNATSTTDDGIIPDTGPQDNPHTAAAYFAQASSAAQETFRDLTNSNTYLQSEITDLCDQ